MKFLTKACFGMLLAASTLSTPAFAQDEEASGPVSLSGGISVVSDYRFRGVSRSDEDPALQARYERIARELRSAKAWREMADRALLIEAERAKAEVYRAERRAAELEATQARLPAE